MPSNSPGNDQYRLTASETKSRLGRPPNPRIPKLMEKGGVSRATVYRRLKAQHGAQLAKLARTGNGRDRLNEHPDGYYPTPPRGTHALLAVEPFVGVVWEPACSDGAISRILESAGFEADEATVAARIDTDPHYGSRLPTTVVGGPLRRGDRPRPCFGEYGLGASPLSATPAPSVGPSPTGRQARGASGAGDCPGASRQPGHP